MRASPFRVYAWLFELTREIERAYPNTQNGGGTGLPFDGTPMLQWASPFTSLLVWWASL